MIPATTNECFDRVAQCALEQTPELRERLLDAAAAEGTLGEAIRCHLQTGGSLLRGRLALVTCSAFEVRPDAALNWAVACELLHNASLVHDDLMDRDEVRRGHPSVWCRFGEANAVLAGDFFLTKAFSVLASPGIDAVSGCRLLRLVGERVSDTIRGQTREFDLVRRVPWTMSDYEDMARLKTAALFSLPAEGALTLAGIDNSSIAPFREQLSWIGLAYQLHDDVADFRPGPAGAALANDLRQGSPNSVVIHYLNQAPDAEKRALQEFLRRPRPLENELEVIEWSTRLAGSDAEYAAIAQCSERLLRGSDGEHLPPVLRRTLNWLIGEISQNLQHRAFV